jgi:two-component system OmpR family response regulator
MRVLLVEDDKQIGKAVENALQDSAFSVDWVQDGSAALSAANNEDYGLILLDLGLPKKDGMEVLIRLRQKKLITPVIIITARNSIDNRIMGLDNGADDYLVKPFSINELQARIRAVVRRKGGSSSPILSNAKVSLNPATKTAERDGKTYTLFAREYAVFHEFMLRPGSVISRDELEEKIYGWNEEVASNAIDFIIHGLRKKLGKDAIINVRGLGWMIDK